MTEQEIAEIQDRLAAATPGPWCVTGDYVASYGREYEIASFGETSVWTARCQRAQEADLIANAPADIAALLTEVKRLRAENAALRARLTITPEKVEDAAKAGHTEWDWNDWHLLAESWQTDWRSMICVALKAAGMVEK